MSIKLDDFVDSTLTAIMEGVNRAAQKHLKSQNKGHINPVPGDRSDDLAAIPIQIVEFDVAVVAESSKSGSGKGGVSVTVFNTGVEGSTSRTDSQASRVKFSVPIAVPVTWIEK